MILTQAYFFLIFFFRGGNETQRDKVNDWKGLERGWKHKIQSLGASFKRIHAQLNLLTDCLVGRFSSGKTEAQREDVASEIPSSWMVGLRTILICRSSLTWDLFH